MAGITGNMSGLGLGCWPLGGDQWGKQDDRDSIAAIKKAYDLGITHFDTAQVYGRGHVEELLGETLYPVRDKCFIATKLLYLNKEKVEDAIGQSLRRLKTDFIDLVYIHWPRKNGDLAGMMEALEKIRVKGAVRLIGVSNFSTADMQEAMRSGRIDAHQLCCNLLWRREEKETIPFCIRNGIAVVTYSSLAEGILTGKFGPEPVFEKGDHRKHTVLFEKEVWPFVHGAVEELKKTAGAAGRPLVHCAVRWLLSRSGVSTVLAGCRNPAQVEENFSSLDGEIGPGVLDCMTLISDRLSPHIPDVRNIFRWCP